MGNIFCRYCMEQMRVIYEETHTHTHTYTLVVLPARSVNEVIKTTAETG